MSKHGWFLRHLVTGRLVRINDVAASLGSVVEAIEDATFFKTREEAFDTYRYLMSGYVSFPTCVIVDATIPDRPTPDADPDDKIARPLADTIAEAVARGAAARAAITHQSDLLTTEEMAAKRARRAAAPRFGAGGFGSRSRPTWPTH